MTFPDALLSLTHGFEQSMLTKATLVLAAGLIAARAAAKARASVRHLTLAATFGALLVLPLTSATLPQVAIPVVVSDTGPAPAAATGAPSGEAPAIAAPSDAAVASAPPLSLPWTAILRWTWAGGAAVLLLVLAAGVWRVRSIRRHALPRPELRELTRTLADRARVRREVDVLEHEDIPAPLTCGLWRPAIILPADAREWTDEDLARALVHELEHIGRGDWTVQLAARVICACYWFHPLVWMAWRRLSLEAERACDDAVIQSAERTDYADQLVGLARRLSAQSAQPVLGMANRSDLSVRVSALLDPSLRRGRAGMFVSAAAVIVAVALVVTIAPLRAIATPPLDPRMTGTQEPAAPDQTWKLRSTRPSALDRAMYEAAAEGDIDAIDQLLKAGANVNAAVDGDGSPLIGAARSGGLATVRHLLDRGADPNMPVPGDGSPLIAASEEGNLAVITLLLDRGATIDLVVPGDENPLITASAAGRLEVVKLLVKRGANVNARVWVDATSWEPRGEWRTPLNMAIKRRHDDVAAFLRSVGARE